MPSGPSKLSEMALLEEAKIKAYKLKK